MSNKYPCRTCKRVKAPYDCNNKNCAIWQEWFLKWWENMRKNCRNALQEMKEKETKQ